MVISEKQVTWGTSHRTKINQTKNTTQKTKPTVTIATILEVEPMTTVICNL